MLNAGVLQLLVLKFKISFLLVILKKLWKDKLRVNVTEGR